MGLEGGPQGLSMRFERARIGPMVLVLEGDVSRTSTVAPVVRSIMILPGADLQEVASTTSSNRFAPFVPKLGPASKTNGL